MSIVLSAMDWWQMLGHFLSLSLLAVGGAIATAPDMHRYLVEQQHWLSQSQFSASMALVGCYVALCKPLVAAIPIFLLGWMRFGIAGVTHIMDIGSEGVFEKYSVDQFKNMSVVGSDDDDEDETDAA